MGPVLLDGLNGCIFSSQKSKIKTLLIQKVVSRDNDQVLTAA